jgi:hypothetical protein
METIKKLFIITVAIFAIFSKHVFSQTKDAFPNAITHGDCNTLLSGKYTITDKDIFDFAKNDIVDLKAITIEGWIAPGKADNLSAIVINHNDYKILFPTDQVKKEVQLSVSNFINNFEGSLANYEDYTFLFTYHRKDVDYMIYFYITDNRLIGYAHPVELGGTFHNCHTELEYAESKLTEEIKYAKEQNKTMIWYGDEIKPDVEGISDRSGSALYRRANSFIKPFPRKIEKLENIFDPLSSTVCNAIPKTKSQLIKGGFAANDRTIKEWGEYAKEIENIINPHFSNHLSTISEIKNEFLNGDKNVLVILAHLKGDELFIGNEKVSLDEINNWGKRERPTGERVAVLFVCNSGNQKYEVGSLLWKKKIEPLSNILIKNNYFDQVIAPNHEIEEKETKDVLDKLIKTKSIMEIKDIFKGWFPFVFSKFTPESNSNKI